MGILSISELHLRILFGELIILEKITKSDKKHERFTNEVLERINESLSEIQKDTENEEKWTTYTKLITSLPGMNAERKSAIDAFAGAILEKTPNEMEKIISGELQERKDLEGQFRKKERDRWILPILIDDIDCKSFRGANFDLRLGENVYVSTDRVPKKLKAAGKDVLPIEPGEFGLLMTQEYIFVPPDLMGIISIRLTHKQKGLVNISGFHVDPGFYGRLMFSVFNAGPKDVLLRYKDRVFMIIFDELTPLEDKYKCQKSSWGGMDNIPMETLSGLSGSSVSVRKLDERLKRMEILLPVLITLLISLLVAFIGWILNHPSTPT